MCIRDRHVRTEGREVMTMEVRPDSALPASDGLEAAIGEEATS